MATTSANLEVSTIAAEYRRLTPGSARLAAAARNVFPSGITHDARVLDPYAIYVERAQGSRKWDVDRREYVDYSGGHGALLLGHNHPVVLDAVERQLKRGTHFGACHELEIRWGELVKRLVPSADLVRFTSSGTEATLLAIRLARAFTGKKKLLRFVGHFHGWHDHVAWNPDGTPPAGVLDELLAHVVLASPGDVGSLRQVLPSRDDIACAIVEPTGSSWGQVPLARDFLTELRSLTAARGVLLIFDEVISGFRCSPGGAQAVLGIKPDLTTLAKILAGGFPGGAVTGRRDVMELLAFPTPGSSPRAKVGHHGTYNANPISAAAGTAALEIVAETDACQRANDYAGRLRDELNRVLRDEDVNWIVYGSYSGFHIFTNPSGLDTNAAEINSCKFEPATLKGGVSPSLVAKLRLGMLVYGVELFVWPGGVTSMAHDPSDLDRTAEAFRRTLRMLKEEGEIQ